MTRRLAMIIDEEICWGCNTCELACKQENNPPEGSRWIRVRTKGVQEVNGRMKLTYHPVRCLHCSRPPCKETCPVDAIRQRPDGIVLVDPERCMGCKACLEVCPFGVMQFNTEKGVAEKCHLCYHRIDRGKRPACIDKCIGRCIYFGEIGELLNHLGDKRSKFPVE